METGANSRQAFIFTCTNFASARAPFDAHTLASRGSDYYEKTSVVKGHHVYKAVWTPFIGEELPVQPEDHNDHDEHAVAFFGHLNGLQLDCSIVRSFALGRHYVGAPHGKAKYFTGTRRGGRGGRLTLARRALERA